MRPTVRCPPAAAARTSARRPPDAAIGRAVGSRRAGYAVLTVLLLGTVALAVPAAAAPPTTDRPALTAWTVGASAASAVSLPAEEQADRLAMDFEVDADGSVVVTETISWRFPDGEERHGIQRNVKVRAGYQESETQYRTTSSPGSR